MIVSVGLTCGIGAFVTQLIRVRGMRGRVRMDDPGQVINSKQGYTLTHTCIYKLAWEQMVFRLVQQTGSPAGKAHQQNQ